MAIRSTLLATFLLVLGLGCTRDAWSESPKRADGALVLKRLERALRDDDKVKRRAAVTDVGRLRSLLDEKQMRRAALALRDAFETEGDRETRRLMVRALAGLEVPAAWIPVLLASFDDRDDVIRTAARREVLRGTRGFLPMLEKLLREDTDPTFRARLLLVLGDRRHAEAVPLLLDHLADKSPRVSSAAVESLEAISGQAHGFNEALWRRWYTFWKKVQAARVRARPHATVETEAARSGDEPPPHVTVGLTPTFFGLPLRGKDLVFVVDISGSVGKDGLARMRGELIRAVERLGSDVRVAALFFSDKVTLWKPALVRATPEAKAELAFFLRGVAPGKRTDVFTPLNAGLQLVRKRVAEKEAAGEVFRTPVTLLIVSDGRNNVDNTPAAVVEEKLDRLDLARTVVHAIVLGGAPHPLMRVIATRGGGRLHLVR